MVKECIISIDGVDKTGKDSVRREIIRLSRGKILVKVRTFISQIAYSRIYNRMIDEEFFIQKMFEYQKIGEKYFMLTTDYEILRDRFIQHRESDLSVTSIKEHSRIFDEVVQVLEGRGIHILHVDTSYDSVLETAHSIVCQTQQ